MANGSITVHPSAVNQMVTNVISANKALGWGSNSSQYISIKFSTGAKTLAYFFDFSAIPASAVITDVSCQVKAARSASAFNGYAGFILDEQTLVQEVLPKTFTNLLLNFALPTQITRSELDRLELRVWGPNGNATAQYYGADLTVSYTYNNEQFFIKSGGAWHGATKVYKKIGGLWVEQTDLSSVVEPGVKYKPG